MSFVVEGEMPGYVIEVCDGCGVRAFEPPLPVHVVLPNHRRFDLCGGCWQSASRQVANEARRLGAVWGGRNQHPACGERPPPHNIPGAHVCRLPQGHAGQHHDWPTEEDTQRYSTPYAWSFRWSER